METSVIHPGAKVSSDCRLGQYCVIEDGVVIDPGVEVGNHVVIHSGTQVGAGTKIGDCCVLGKAPTPAATSTAKKRDLPPLRIGKNCILGSHVVIYRGTEVGDSCFFGDYASVRENCRLGSSVLVGQKATIENDVEIGDYTKIQTGAYITAYSKLEDHVFVAPMVTTTNDNYMGRTEKRFASRRGPVFRRGCRVGGRSLFLPGVTVGQEGFVAAGSVVTRDVPSCKLVMGSPARLVREVPREELLFPPDQTIFQIPSFDLKRQNALLKEELLQALTQVVEKGQFILGENVKAFEEEVAELCGALYGIGVASGSNALYLALLACGVGPGDEVITTPFTFFATAGSIARTGAVPVFVDIDPETYNIDPEQVAVKITPATKAILPVHLYGQAADLDPLLEIARAHGLKVIEDAAQAIGAKYKERPVGGIGDAGCFSFFPTKNLGCFGDGGMVVTNDPGIAECVRMLRVHGSRKKYYHEMLGCNSRLDEVQAVVLRVKLKHLPHWTQRRRKIAFLYNKLFEASGLIEKGLVRISCKASGSLHVYHQYTVTAKDRDLLQRHLKEKGIGSAVYYPLPLHLQEVFCDLGYKEGDFPNAERAAGEVLSLPMFPELTDEEVRQVVEAVVEFYEKLG